MQVRRTRPGDSSRRAHSSVVRAPRSGQAGASAVEFALILPLLLMILLGIIDFGRLEYERITVTQAAFEGARASGFKRSLTTVTSIVNATASPLRVTITNTTNFDCTAADSTTSVTVFRPSPFVWYTPFLRAFTTTVSATGAYRCLS